MINPKFRGAWFGDPLLKERTVNLMKRHRELDSFTQGLYQRDPGLGVQFKGCAVGCLVETSKLGWMEEDKLRLLYDGDNRTAGFWHMAVEDQFNIPAHVAASIDSFFEHQGSFQDAGVFAVAVVEAIPVGADLSGIVDGDHDCDDPPASGGRCFQCDVIDDWYENTDLFIEALANAPLVPAARALVLAG